MNSRKIYEGAYTNLQRANIEYDYLRGIPIKEILRKYGICRRALYNAINRWNIDKKIRLDKKYNKIIVALKFGGMTPKEAAQINKVSVYSVWRICKIKKFNLRWRTMKFTEMRKKKLLAENLSWKHSNKLFYESKKRHYKV